MAIKMSYENDKLVQLVNDKHELWIREKDDGNLVVEFCY